MGSSPRDRPRNQQLATNNQSQLKPTARFATPTPLPKQTAKRRFPAVVAWLAIGLATGGLAGFGWLGIQLIVNPQGLLWINRFLPDWIPIPVTGLKPPQTLDTIRLELTQAGQIPGDLLPLGTNVSFLDHKTTVTDWVLPILTQRSNCQDACNQIVALRLYQSVPDRHALNAHTAFLQLIDQQAIDGPDESFVIAPLINAGDDNQGSTRALPLMTIARFEGKVPSQGVWLNLSGRWERGDRTIAYGQVLHYNPKRFRLQTLLEWSSPAGHDPTWRPFTGSQEPSLVIDQTVGMEPQFLVYQVKPRHFLLDPIQLEPISLLDGAIVDGAYDDGLLLARSGLWSVSQRWLETVRQRHQGRNGDWSESAQAQLDLIALHAQATRTQAEQSWASPSQQVLANLIDGRWERALKVFIASSENSLETASLLKADSGRLQRRVAAVLQVNPAQSAAKAWGALLMAAQQSRTSAIAWLKKQPQTTSADITRISALLSRLDPTFAANQPTASLAPGQFVGAAAIVDRINPVSWLKPKQSPPLKLDRQQVWYQIQLAAFQDGKRWRSGSGAVSAAATAETLWTLLGLTADPPVQIVIWLPNGNQQTMSASIKAVRVTGAGIQLLAAGDTLSESVAKLPARPHPLAFTDSALQWVNPEVGQLSDVVQQRPDWAATALPILGQELTQAGLLPSGTKLTWDTLAQLGVGTLPTQQIELTNSGQPDVVLTIDATAFTDLAHAHKKVHQKASRPHTLIFSATGKLLYNELSGDAGQIYLAIADLGDGGSNALIVDGAANYRLLRWSAQQKRFE